MRLAHTISGSAPGLISRTELKPSAGKLLLRLPTRDRSVFAGDAVERRLKTLASVLGFEGSGFGKLPDRDD